MRALDEIYKITDTLYIGAYWPRLNFKKIKRASITAIVNLMHQKYYRPPRRLYAYLHKGFDDDTYPSHDIISDVLRFIGIHIKEKNGKVLVHCAMGISRSGGLVVAWLLKENPAWSWTKAMDFVCENRDIAPAVEIRESILDYFEKIEGKRRKL